jgi:hypothetical protein
MGGLVTERDLEEAECAFPGIGQFYRALPCKPATFLDLVRLYLNLGHSRGTSARTAPNAPSGR